MLKIFVNNAAMELVADPQKFAKNGSVKVLNVFLINLVISVLSLVGVDAVFVQKVDIKEGFQLHHLLQRHHSHHVRTLPQMRDCG